MFVPTSMGHEMNTFFQPMWLFVSRYPGSTVPIWQVLEGEFRAISHSSLTGDLLVEWVPGWGNGNSQKNEDK